MDNRFKWKKKKQRTRRELTGDWPDDKIRELIYNVKIRPELWNIGATNYRIPKPQSWQEVASQLGEEYDWRDCRLKWQNLRVTYKCNINKIAKKQSEGKDAAPRILWRFFHLMQFVSKVNHQKKITNCTSNCKEIDSRLNLEAEVTSASCSTLASQKHFDFKQSSSNVIKQESLTMEAQQKSLPPPSPSPTPPLPSPSPFVTATSSKIYKSPQQNLQLKQIKNKNDEYACFGNFIASELRNLPHEHSFALKRRLNRTLLDYWDEMEAQKQSSMVITKKEDVESILLS